MKLRASVLSSFDGGTAIKLTDEDGAVRYSINVTSPYDEPTKDLSRRIGEIINEAGGLET